MLWFLLVVVLGVVAWFWLKFEVLKALAQRGRRAHARVHAPRPRIDLEGNGFDQQAVGESHYQEALRRAAKPGAARTYCDAQLSPENDNPHDENAVAVTVGGAVVGYLPRAAARKYRKQHGDGVGRCRGVIVGGRDKSYGIWLDAAI